MAIAIGIEERGLSLPGPLRLTTYLSPSASVKVFVPLIKINSQRFDQDCRVGDCGTASGGGRPGRGQP